MSKIIDKLLDENGKFKASLSEIEQLEFDIIDQTQYIFGQENADDFYYTKGTGKNDQAILSEMRRKLEQLYRLTPKN